MPSDTLTWTLTSTLYLPSDVAARFAALAPTERETLVTELLAEVERVTAERDKLLDWLAENEWSPDLADWQGAPTAIEAVRKAAGLDQE